MGGLGYGVGKKFENKHMKFFFKKIVSRGASPCMISSVFAPA
jgi:hypothetical protein